jgi:O-antigen/teichoic acid export membrane protein
LLLGGGLMLVLVLVAPLLSADARVTTGIQVSAPLVLIGPLFGTYSALFRARRVMWPIAVLNVAMLAAQVALTATAIAAGGSVLAALIVNLLTSAGQLIAAWLIWRHMAGLLAMGSPVALAPLLRRSGAFAIAGVLAALHLRIGLILLENLGGAESAGHYAAAVRFIEAANLVARAFFDALFPLLAGLAADPPALRRVFRRTLLGLSGAGLLGTITLIAATPALIAVTYGPAFTAAGPVLVVAALALVPGLLKSAQTLYWYARGREGFVNAVTLGALLLRVVLSLWLIPGYGAVGAAWANLAVEIVSAAVLLLPRPHS